MESREMESMKNRLANKDEFSLECAIVLRMKPRRGKGACFVFLM